MLDEINACVQTADAVLTPVLKAILAGMTARRTKLNAAGKTNGIKVIDEQRGDLEDALVHNARIPRSRKYWLLKV